MPGLDPRKTLDYLAQAIPHHLHGELLVSGSLAAAAQFFRLGETLQLDEIECILTPHKSAVKDAQLVISSLLQANWTHHPDASPNPDDKGPLANVRLCPPDADWTLRLLTVPSVEGIRPERIPVQLDAGRLCLTAPPYVGLVAYRPKVQGLSIPCARPVMMALANLLAAPSISDETLPTPIAGKSCKRANRDLGRAAALAMFSAPGSVETLWPDAAIDALQRVFPTLHETIIDQKLDGLAALLTSEDDLEEAWHSAVNDLLCHKKPSLREFHGTCKHLHRRLVQDLLLSRSDA